MIVETEAYMGVTDKSCHTYGGRRTKCNEAMFMSSGTIYVYKIHGIYHCFNLSAEEEGAVVLLRAVQPLEGIDSMNQLRTQFQRRRRQTSSDDNRVEKPYKPKMLANGPSKLCIAFDITKDNMNKVDITNSSLIWIE
ncbi:unnamed protein product, partial [Medioppia subpectinata]